jgi:hypothetical protein
MIGKKVFEIEFFTSKTTKGETERDTILAEDADEALSRFKDKHPTDAKIVGMKFVGARG